MRLIDADELKADLRMADDCKDCKTNARDCEYDRVYTKMDFCAWLDDAPTVDAIPVVRCKNCKYSDGGTDEDGKLFLKCLGWVYGGTREDDFCSHGERNERKDGDELRLIDADALYKAMQDAEELARRRVLDTESTLPYPTNLNPAYTRYLAQMDERTKAKEMVADAPTVDAVPVRHGRWKMVEGELAFWDMCSACGRKIVHRTPYYDFCPNCGARMDGKDGEGRE